MAFTAACGAYMCFFPVAAGGAGQASFQLDARTDASVCLTFNVVLSNGLVIVFSAFAVLGWRGGGLRTVLRISFASR
jgi:hypothetical protein